jgi:hypothetical protein
METDRYDAILTASLPAERSAVAGSAVQQYRHSGIDIAGGIFTFHSDDFGPVPITHSPPKTLHIEKRTRPITT